MKLKSLQTTKIDLIRYSSINTPPMTMKIKSLALTAGIAIGGIIASGAFTPAQAFTVFFGEDRNASIGANPVNGTNPLTNSDAARANFVSNLTNVGTQTFESYATGATTPLVVTYPGAGTSTFDGTLTGPGNIRNGATSAGRFPVSGTQSYEVTANGFTINFNTPVAAFGLYGTDIGDFNGQLTLQLNDTANTLLTVPNSFGVNGTPAAAPNGSALYYSFLTTDPNQTFTRVTFGNTAAGVDIFGFDNLTVGTPLQVIGFNSAQSVPEPFTVIGSLIGGTAAFRMRKKLKSTNKA